MKVPKLGINVDICMLQQTGKDRFVARQFEEAELRDHGEFIQASKESLANYEKQ